LHARPASLLAKLASSFDAKVMIVRDSTQIDAKSILDLLTLAATQGTELQIQASGLDAEKAVQALVDLIERDFVVEEAPQANQQQIDGPHQANQ
jgi:phosphotransferase system HPr (HPr) family protein